MTDDGNLGGRDEGGRDADALARRAVDSFMMLVRRGTALAGGALMIVFVICTGGFVLGLAALSDGIRTVWIGIGGAFWLLGVGSVVLAIVRLLAIRKHSGRLVEEVHDLIVGDARTERVVIETLESSDGVQDQSAVVMSRQFFTMQSSVGDRSGQFMALSSALRAITTFPLLMLLGTVITVGFAGLSLIFLLALAI